MFHRRILKAATLAALVGSAPANVAVIDPDAALPEADAAVWTPLFQATWDAVREFRGTALVAVEPENPLITKLQNTKWDRDAVMPQGGFAVYAGPSTPEFLRDMNSAITRQFGLEFDAAVPPPARPDGIAARGVLSRDLNFQKALSRSRSRGLQFRGSDGTTREIAFFGTAGTNSGLYSNSINVLDYTNAGRTFILRLSTQHEGESVIIDMNDDAATTFESSHRRVRGAVESFQNGVNRPPEGWSLNENDTVKIPYLRARMNTDLSSQMGGSLHFEGGELPHRIIEARQIVEFDLIETGARLRAQTFVMDEPFGPPPTPPPPPRPRSFVCDRPFFVHLWREGANWPYLSIRVEADATLPFE